MSTRPNASLLAYNLARVAAHRDQPAEALAQLELALAGGLSGQGTEPYELLAKLLADLGQKDQLIGRLEKLRSTKADSTPLTFFLAETYRKAAKTELAEPLYRQLCDPGQPTICPRCLARIHRPLALRRPMGDLAAGAGRCTRPDRRLETAG